MKMDTILRYNCIAVVSVCYVEAKMMFLQRLSWKDSQNIYSVHRSVMKFFPWWNSESVSTVCNLPSHCVCMYGTVCLPVLHSYPRYATWCSQQDVWLSYKRLILSLTVQVWKDETFTSVSCYSVSRYTVIATNYYFLVHFFSFQIFYLCSHAV
jgi:hypothetical protein